MAVAQLDVPEIVSLLCTHAEHPEVLVLGANAIKTLITSDVTTTAFHEFQRAAEVRFKAWYAKYIKEHGVRTPPKTLLAPLSGAIAGATATSSLPAYPYSLTDGSPCRWTTSLTSPDHATATTRC